MATTTNKMTRIAPKAPNGLRWQNQSRFFHQGGRGRIPAKVCSDSTNGPVACNAITGTSLFQAGCVRAASGYS